MTRDIFTARVSVFAGVNGARMSERYKGDCSLHDFLFKGGKRFAQQIADIRAERQAMADTWAAYEAAIDSPESDTLKAAYNQHKKAYTDKKKALPAALVQGSSRDGDTFFSYSDLVLLDIDESKPDNPDKDNEIGTDWIALRAELGRIPFVGYCGLSVGGRGLILIVPIESHEHHLEHWLALEAAFKSAGLQVDESTKNINRLRFITYDPDAVINHQASIFTKRLMPHEEKPRPAPPQRFWGQYPESDTYAEAERLVCELEKGYIAIADDYDAWIKAAAGIAHTFGERGRDLFHRIAKLSNKYKYKENDRLYTNLMKSGGSASINSFFWLCKSAGVDIRTAKPQRRYNIPIPRPRQAPAPPQRSTTETPAVDSSAAIQTANTETDTPKATDEQPQRAVPKLTKGEAAEYLANIPTINKAVQRFYEIRCKRPGLALLEERLGLEMTEAGGVKMTSAQFDKFMSENPAPPF